MEWLNRRRREPTTWLGLAAVIAGFGQVFKIAEAPAIAETVGQVAQPIAAGDWATAAMLIVGGIAGTFMGEKGGR